MIQKEVILIILIAIVIFLINNNDTVRPTIKENMWFSPTKAHPRYDYLIGLNVNNNPEIDKLRSSGTEVRIFNPFDKIPFPTNGSRLNLHTDFNGKIGYITWG